MTQKEIKIQNILHSNRLFKYTISTFEASNEYINKKASSGSEGSSAEKRRQNTHSSFQSQRHNTIITLTGSYPSISAPHSIDINSIYVYPLNVLEQCNKLYLLVFFTDALNCSIDKLCIPCGILLYTPILRPIKDLLTFWRQKLDVTSLYQ